MLYTSIAEAPGGPPDIDPPRMQSAAVREAAHAEADRITALRTCARPTCGGPVYCVHRHLGNTVTREAAWHWRFFDAPVPLVDSDVRRARRAVSALLEQRVHPVDWPRCGASAEVLAVLGYTIDDVVRTSKILLEDVIDGLDIDEQRLRILGFHPALLAHRHHYPVGVLTKAPLALSATRLLRFAPISYRTLASTYGLSHEELAALGFTAPLLMQLGMRGDDILEAVRHEHVRAHTNAQPAWWVRAMHMTPALLDAAFPSSLVTLMSMEDKITYSLLDVTTRSCGADARA